MESPAKTNAVIIGVSGAAAQDLFRDVVDRWRPVLRIAGVIAQDHGLPDRACSAGYLCRIGTEKRFPIFEDRGPGSTLCQLDAGGALTASEAVQQDIASGCDLVILSKFGRLEAAGKGLRRAFEAAMQRSIPLLTSASPSVAEKWKRFAVPGFIEIQTDAVEIDAWISAVLSGVSPIEVVCSGNPGFS